MSGECPERSRLGKAVVNAVAEVYLAKETYNTAKQDPAKDVTELGVVLMKARGAERIATKALGEHIKEHGCKA